MRVVVVGSVGPVERSPVASAVLAELAVDATIDDVVAVGPRLSSVALAHGRRPPAVSRARLVDDLTEQARFADAVVCLGWLAGGDHHGDDRWLTVVDSACRAAARAGVRVFVYGSLAGSYAEGRQGPAGEELPVTGRIGSHLSLQLSHGERLADRLDQDHEVMRVVRLRTGLPATPTHAAGGWQGRAARSVARLALGRGAVPVPDVRGAALSVVDARDLARAFRLAVTTPVAGAFNVATDPVTDEVLARALGPRRVRLPRSLAGVGFRVAARTGLFPLEPDWGQLEILPPLSTELAARQLRWVPRRSAADIVREWSDAVCQRSDGRRRRMPPRSGSASGSPCPPGGSRRSSVPVAPPGCWDGADPTVRYRQELARFGELVHRIEHDQWGATTGPDGPRLVELVGEAARRQRRVAMLLEGADADEADRQLVGDPLGFDRADGWDLAAQRAEQALDEVQAVPAATAGAAATTAGALAELERALEELEGWSRQVRQESSA